MPEGESVTAAPRDDNLFKRSLKRSIPRIVGNFYNDSSVFFPNLNRDSRLATASM